MNSPLSTFETNLQATMAERRVHQRVKVSVQAELRPQGRDVPIRVHTSDLSAGGCYVEMMFTLEPQSLVDVVLWLSENEAIRTSGVVVTRHPQFGNGIKFVSITSQDQRRLQRFLDSVLATRDSSGLLM